MRLDSLCFASNVGSPKWCAFDNLCLDRVKWINIPACKMHGSCEPSLQTIIDVLGRGPQNMQNSCTTTCVVQHVGWRSPGTFMHETLNDLADLGIQVNVLVKGLGCNFEHASGHCGWSYLPLTRIMCLGVETVLGRCFRWEAPLRIACMVCGWLHNLISLNVCAS